MVLNLLVEPTFKKLWHKKLRTEARLLHNVGTKLLYSTYSTSQTKQTGREKKRGKSVYTNLVSTFCYLSLEGELWELLHGRRRQRLLRGHPHATEDDDDDSEDEEHAARHVDENVGVVVLLLCTNCFGMSNMGLSGKMQVRDDNIIIIISHHITLSKRNMPLLCSTFCPNRH